MVIAREQRQELAEQIIAAGTGPLGYALQSADHMAIDDVARALEEHVAWEHGELCDRFIGQWLPRLAPLQRLAAALAVEGLYATALVHLPHAEDRGLHQLLTCAAAGLGELAERLGLAVGAHKTSAGGETAITNEDGIYTLKSEALPVNLTQGLDELGITTNANIVFEFPGEVLESNVGTVDGNKVTVSDLNQLKQSMNIKAKSTPGGGDILMWVLVGVGILLLLGLVLWLLLRKKGPQNGLAPTGPGYGPQAGPHDGGQPQPGQQYGGQPQHFQPPQQGQQFPDHGQQPPQGQPPQGPPNPDQR